MVAFYQYDVFVSCAYYQTRTTLYSLDRRFCCFFVPISTHSNPEVAFTSRPGVKYLAVPLSYTRLVSDICTSYTLHTSSRTYARP